MENRVIWEIYWSKKTNTYQVRNIGKKKEAKLKEK